MLMSRISSDANPAIRSGALRSAAPAGEAIARPMTGSIAAIGAQLRQGAATALDALTHSSQPPGIHTTLRVAKRACDPQQTAEISNPQMRPAVGNIALLHRSRLRTFTLTRDNSVSLGFIIDGDLLDVLA
ncbi:hypothetical protein AAFX91_30215 [Bradyrhizobium sp. 31Argb]|uniref:hypothetical protein n=1 Tax=Bradyrhizobium sp. 31Argb TaxID=3141247 RepID=UPI003748E930